MVFSGRGAKRRGHCLAGRDGDGRAPVHGLFPRREDDPGDRRGLSSRISQREGAPICTGTRTGHPWHPDQSVGLRYSNIGLPQLEAGQKVCSATIFVHSGVSRILWLRFNSYINERKQHEEIHYRRHCCTYYVDGYLHDDWSVTDLHQNQGVIVCPGCQGKGNIGGQKCQRCKGRGILKSNGMPL